MLIEGVNIRQNQTYTVEIPNPGQLQLNITRDVMATIFTVKDNKMEWVAEVDGTKTLQYITMQPGDYKLVYRLKSETRTLYTKKLDFKISSGTNTVLSL
jgi:Ca-activated chloride channel family protein